MQKTLWYDTETTGLDHLKNDIVQFSAIAEIDGEIKEKFDIKIQPISFENISQEALDVHGYGLDELKEFTTPEIAFVEIKQFLSKYINKYDKGDKFLSAGQNVKFDIDFLRSFFIKLGDNFFGSFFDYHFLDLQAITALLIRNKKILPKSYKLIDVAEVMNVDLGENAHNSMADIEATMKVYKAYEKIIFGDKNE